jgi:opacity protein-like surface antigen
MKFTWLLVGVCLLSGVARADDDVDFGRSSAYVGVGASRSINLLEDFLSDNAVLKHIGVSDNWGVNGRAGYHITSWLAIEGEYEWLEPFQVDFAGTHIGEFSTQSATVNLKLILPLRRFQPYFLLGAGAAFLDVRDRRALLSVDSTAFAGRVGLGIDIYLTRNLYLNAGAEGLLSDAKVSLITPSGTFEERGIGTVDIQAGFGWRF